MASNKFLGYGQVDVEQVSIQHRSDDYDISSMVIEFAIFESIHNFSLSGYLMVVDTNNLISNLDLSGGESIKIRFGTRGLNNVNTHMFELYKISPRDVEERTQTYKLMFTTEEMMINSNIMVSRSFNTGYHEIIKGVVSQYLKSDKKFINTTKLNSGTVISPMWRPHRIIKHCIGRGGDGSLSPIMFWETLKGFNLRSLSDVYGSLPKKTFIRQPAGEWTGATKDLDREFNNVSAIEYEDMHDRLKMQASGSFRAEVTYFDMKTKSTFMDVPGITTQVKLDDVHIQPYKSQSNHFRMTMTSTDGSHTAKQSKISMMTLMNAIRFNIVASGDSTLSSGDIITFDIPSPEITASKRHRYERNISGKFLVQDIKHQVNMNESYSQHITIVKDSTRREV